MMRRLVLLLAAVTLSGCAAPGRNAAIFVGVIALAVASSDRDDSHSPQHESPTDVPTPPLNPCPTPAACQ